MLEYSNYKTMLNKTISTPMVHAKFIPLVNSKFAKADLTASISAVSVYLIIYIYAFHFWVHL